MNLPKGHTVLSADERPITAVLWNDAGQSHWRVGQFGVTGIEAYDENGSMSHVPWIAVFKGEEIISRFPAEQVIVSYQ